MIDVSRPTPSSTRRAIPAVVQLVAALAALLVAGVARPALAGAHTELTPAAAAPGTIVRLELFVEDERSAAGTTAVRLAFPAGSSIKVVELPPVAGWTATVEPATATAPLTVSWSGGPAPDDVRLPLVIGPLPDQVGQVQFKVVQTYDDGSVDRWIEDWPAGMPEPAKPGPVLRLEQGAAGERPTTAASTTAASTTAASTTAASTTAAAPAASTRPEPPSPTTTTAPDDNAGSPVGIIVAVGLLTALALGVIGVLVRVRQR